MTQLMESFGFLIIVIYTLAEPVAVSRDSICYVAELARFHYHGFRLATREPVTTYSYRSNCDSAVATSALLH